MNTANWNNRKLSRLMLGTVQFGMPYGVANRTGQPSYRDVRDIVAAAIEGGVNCFDTAAAYGTSEEVLGKVIRELNVADHVTVVTKIRPLTTEEQSTPPLAAMAIEQSIAESRRRLQLNTLPIVLFHRETDAQHREILHELRTRGWLEHVGVSCDNRPGPAAAFAAAGDLTALQIPGNVIDRRHQQGGSLKAAAQQGVAVFIRSVYLQGLLLMAEKDVPEKLQAVIPVRRQLESVANEAGMELGELAVRYILSQPEVTCVLTGVETLDQIQKNLTIFDHGPLPDDLRQRIDEISIDLPESVLTPGQWNLQPVQKT